MPNNDFLKNHFQRWIDGKNNETIEYIIGVFDLYWHDIGSAHQKLELIDKIHQISIPDHLRVTAKIALPQKLLRTPDRMKMIDRHPLDIHREPHNPHDKNAIMVSVALENATIMQRDQKRIGYLTRKSAQILAPMLDRGEKALFSYDRSRSSVQPKDFYVIIEGPAIVKGIRQLLQNPAKFIE